MLMRGDSMPMLSPEERERWRRIGRLIAEADLRRLGIELKRTKSG